MQANIHAENISVIYPIFHSNHRSLKNAVLSLATGGVIAKDSRKNSIVTSLDSLSFTFDHGERIGLVGHNGAGKTTLLQVLAGIAVPVKGKINVTGKVVSLTDLSMGFDFDSTGYENIYLRGVMEGLSGKDIETRMDEIAEFSELGDFLNFPIRTYSSGMLMRLGFAISTNINPDILIMDEWLSVGDGAFKKKAQMRLQKILNNTSILVIATHEKRWISSICTRVITLEHGKIISDIPNTPTNIFGE
ncbi:MAG: ABC transporter ATP-binding protein [Alphaproteobacteria bacterium]|nr:ABC transporter ATP-binding protein [Alphaproteobacteria bacterium]